MTKKEARTEAKRRFGRNADVDKWSSGEMRFTVLDLVMSDFECDAYRVVGRGKSWEEALQDAEVTLALSPKEEGARG